MYETTANYFVSNLPHTTVKFAVGDKHVAHSTAFRMKWAKNQAAQTVLLELKDCCAGDPDGTFRVDWMRRMQC